MTDDEKFLAWLGLIKERLEKMKISLLEFDDAGDPDEEPVKGVTMGHIRAWHDYYAEFEYEAHRDYQALESELGKMTGALQRARKLIWSHPVEAERILTDAVEQKL